MMTGRVGFPLLGGTVGELADADDGAEPADFVAAADVDVPFDAFVDEMVGERA